MVKSFAARNLKSSVRCGIARQNTTPYTPHQNGVAERMNKTLMERTRSMFSGAELG